MRPERGIFFAGEAYCYLFQLGKPLNDSFLPTGQLIGRLGLAFFVEIQLEVRESITGREVENMVFLRFPHGLVFVFSSPKVSRDCFQKKWT